jgi:hypothetical protein
MMRLVAHRITNSSMNSGICPFPKDTKRQPDTLDKDGAKSFSPTLSIESPLSGSGMMDSEARDSSRVCSGGYYHCNTWAN